MFLHAYTVSMFACVWWGGCGCGCGCVFVWIRVQRGNQKMAQRVLRHVVTVHGGRPLCRQGSVHHGLGLHREGGREGGMEGLDVDSDCDDLRLRHARQLACVCVCVCMCVCVCGGCAR
jgi:hypothetical protein